jgi:tetratricopeptide (TPR) repeat protein
MRLLALTLSVIFSASAALAENETPAPSAFAPMPSVGFSLSLPVEPTSAQVAPLRPEKLAPISAMPMLSPVLKPEPKPILSEQENIDCVRKGDAYFELGQFEKAIEQYKKVPLGSARALGDAYMKVKDYHAAGEAFEASGAKDTYKFNTSTFFKKAGEAYFKAKEYANAAAAYDKAWGKYGHDFFSGVAYNNEAPKLARRADALVQTGGDSVEAAKLFRKALAIQHKLPRIPLSAYGSYSSSYSDLESEVDSLRSKVNDLESQALYK